MVKTLGTGTYDKKKMGCAKSADGADGTLPGTFARVWLAEVTKPGSKDEEKVFALKVLRKADGMLSQSLPNPARL